MKYALFQSPAGLCLIAHSGKGVCALSLVDKAADAEPILLQLQEKYSDVAVEDAEGLQSYIRATLAFLEGRHHTLEFPLDVRGTDFQQQIWQALQAIPYGQTRSYKDIAAAIGNPRAVRAAGGACGANPVLLAIPCHRVIETGGGLGGFSRKRRALDKKRWLLALEQSAAGVKQAA